MRSCHGPDCDYGKQSLTLTLQNLSSWTDFPQISIESKWDGKWEIFLGCKKINLVFVFSTCCALEPKPFSANLFRSFCLVLFLSFVAHFIVILSNGISAG